MRQERLFEAIGLVDDRLVEEAADARRTATPWKKWGALAATLVLVVGLGSLTLTTMFRGCGGAASDASSASAADTADSSSAAGDWGADSAAPEEPWAHGAESGDATMESAAGAAADEEAEDDAAQEDFLDAPLFTSYAAPVLPLTAEGGEALVASRQVVWDVGQDADYADVTDRYVLKNTSDAPVTVDLAYPVAADLNGFADCGLTVTVQGLEIPVTLTAGDPLAGYPDQDDINTAWISDWSDVEAVLDENYRAAAGKTADILDTPVTVWRFADVTYDKDTVKSGASLAVFFDQPEDTRLLTYGINGFWADGGRVGCDFFVENIIRRGSARQELIFLGDAPETYTVQGFTDGSMEEEQDGVTGSIQVRETTLGQYLRGITGSELEYLTAARLLEESVLVEEPSIRYEPAMLEHILDDNLAADRVVYAEFQLTIAPRASVEAEAAYRKEASYNFYVGADSDVDLFGFALAAFQGSTLDFREQTALLNLPEGVVLEQDSIGFGATGTAVPLPIEQQEHYHIAVRRTR